MKKQKDRLSHKQFAILRRQQRDTSDSDQWLQTQGLDPSSCNVSDLTLIQAQVTANSALTHLMHLLTTEQAQALTKFCRQMDNKRTCARLRAADAVHVFAIARQIRRKAFKQQRQQQRL